jgi:hypothetical protein
MVSVAVARLPTAVSLLLLEALFMQISGVSLALAWPLRLCLLRVLLCASRCYKLSPFQAHWGRWHCTRFLRPVCLFTAHVGSGSSPLSCGVFLPLPLLQAFLLLIAGHMPLLPPEPLQPSPACLFSVPGKIPLPPLQSSGHPTLFAMCLYCSYCLLLSFSFFPGWGSLCLRAMLIWLRVVCGSTAVPWSSPCPHLPKPSGCGQLAAWEPSWFLNLTWSGDALHRLDVWRGQSFASSRWPCLQGVSPTFLQDFTIGGTLSASSL